VVSSAECLEGKREDYRHNLCYIVYHNNVTHDISIHKLDLKEIGLFW